MRPIGPSVLELRDPDVGGRPARHAALARPEAEDVVPAGRVAQAAHEVAAVGDRQHVRRERDRRAAAAAARRLRAVERVARDAEHLVEGVRAEAELGRVGLADDDAAGRLHALDHQRVVVGHAVGEQRRAERARECRFVSAASLIACGMPCIQPRLSPRASAASRASAWRSRSSLRPAG